MAGQGRARQSRAWYSVWYGMVWYGMAWHGMAWHGMVWYGMVWCDVVWCGMVWCGMVWHGMVWSSSHDTTRPEGTRFLEGSQFRIFGLGPKSTALRASDAAPFHFGSMLQRKPVSHSLGLRGFRV